MKRRSVGHPGGTPPVEVGSSRPPPSEPNPPRSGFLIREGWWVGSVRCYRWRQTRSLSLLVGSAVAMLLWSWDTVARRSWRSAIWVPNPASF